MTFLIGKLHLKGILGGDGGGVGIVGMLETAGGVKGIPGGGGRGRERVGGGGGKEWG